MSDEDKDREIADAVRTSESARGRTYSGSSLEPEWLANETMEYCKTQGWESSLKKVPNSNTWLVVSDRVVALVEGTSNEFVVKVVDLNPVYLKSALVANGLLALTGVGALALPLAGVAAGRASARKAKVTSLVQFIDERVQSCTRQSVGGHTPQKSIADKIRDLASLRDQGLVTADEFEAKRQELLKHL
jgi:hypothetical protein